MSCDPFPRIENPCPKKWDSLEGTGFKRFCGDCQLHVHNLSEMPARERSDFLKAAGHKCIAYSESPITRKLDCWRWELFKRSRLLRPIGLLVAMIVIILSGGCASLFRKNVTAGPPVTSYSKDDPMSEPGERKGH